MVKDVEFRVYSGILAEHSPVLKNLLAEPGHPLRSVPMPGGLEAQCPVVPLTDSPEDLRHLLRAYMPTEESTRCTSTDLYLSQAHPLNPFL